MVHPALAHVARPAVLAGVIVGTLLAVSGLQGCSRHSPPTAGDGTGTAGPQSTASETAARIGGRTLTLADVDALVAAQLLVLDHQRYQLRRLATEALLLRELTAPDAAIRTARIALTPPVPAAVELPGTPAAQRPGAAAPVTLTVFCNFQSPHCAALQSTLADLLSLYPGSLRIAARDLPLPMHALAPLAAEAARCAGQQGKYWAFHDLLWARGRDPDRAELDAVAQASGLDAAAFATCVQSHSESRAVAADVELAHRLGLGIVPAVFVNGRPAVTPATADQLMWLVESELQGAGVKRAGTKASQPTTLPLALRATIVGEMPGLGLAVIGGPQPDAPGAVRREGERVTPESILRRVGPDGVELLVSGRVETLSFASGAQPGKAAATSDGAPGAAQPPTVVTTPVAGAMPVFLDREMVRERMADRVALSARLQPVEMTVDGYRLLRLDDVPTGSLYELLGLQQGDVIVAVNEQPIHEGDNPLWDALDREPEVRVRVMRRGGLAQHYTYRFQ